MTDRRRNLFVLLLVAGLLAGSIFVIATQTTRLGLDLKGGVSLIYQAKPTKQTQVTGEADRPHARHHAQARRPARRRRAGDPALGLRPDRRLAARRPERRRGGAAGRHDRAAVLLRLGAERPRPRLQAGPDGPERHRRPGRGRAARGSLSQLRRGHPRVQLPRAQLRPSRPRTASTTSSTRRPSGSSRAPARRRRGPQPGDPERAHQARPQPEGRRGQARHDHRPRGVAGRLQAEPTAGTSCATSPRSAATTSGTRSRPSTTAPAAAAARSSPSSSPTAGAPSGRTPRARSPSAARSSSSPARTRRAPTSTSRSCSTTS